MSSGFLLVGLWHHPSWSGLVGLGFLSFGLLFVSSILPSFGLVAFRLRPLPFRLFALFTGLHRHGELLVHADVYANRELIVRLWTGSFGVGAVGLRLLALWVLLVLTRLFTHGFVTLGVWLSTLGFLPFHHRLCARWIVPVAS